MLGPVETKFYNEGDFYFKGDEVDYEEHFKDNDLLSRFVEVLIEHRNCMSFSIQCPYDEECELIAKNFREVISNVEGMVGAISLGVSKCAEGLHLILASDKFRQKDYRETVAKYAKLNMPIELECLKYMGDENQKSDSNEVTKKVNLF
ncbi:hypothetical protein [Paraclostridium bifermentans]|uniref:hypothetical protein n=1 Tax=Paraclostridium bifermentans TaxID=1490 RepID=UPI00374EA654